MRGARRRPAPEQHVDADGQVDQPDETQGQLQAPVRRLGDHQDRRVQRNAVARDRVLGLAVDAGAVELPLQVGQMRNRSVVDRGEQIVRLEAGALAGAIPAGLFSASSPLRRRLAPPHPVIGLLKTGSPGGSSSTARNTRPAVATASSVACTRLKRLVSMGSTLRLHIHLHVGCHA